MRVPFNNGKIKIGQYYEPTQYVETDPDMLLLQSYLICDPKLLRKRALERLIYGLAVVSIVLIIWAVS